MVIRTLVAIIGGVFLGLLVTIERLDDANRSVAVGPWRGPPRQGSGTKDPYVLAADARAGTLPLGAAEGLTFVADSDSDGASLEGRCDYTVDSPIPAARFWTLNLLGTNGFPIANPAGRYGFTSADVLRLVGEPVRIIVSSEARSGNWLPNGGLTHYVLMLRLYDTGLSTVGTVLEASSMPSIRRLACR